MRGSKIVHLEGIGPVLIEHSRRARRLNVSVRPPRFVRVAVPTRVSLDEALEFVILKRPWIKRHLARFHALEPKRRALADLSTAIDRTEARRLLTSRLDRLARACGFRYNRVFIRSQKTRWGSCSHKGNISLNVKLVLLPEELMDYVILHELVHTKIHDHSQRFWEELDRHVGNGKALASRLKKYGYGLL